MGRERREGWEGRGRHAEREREEHGLVGKGETGRERWGRGGVAGKHGGMGVEARRKQGREAG